MSKPVNYREKRTFYVCLFTLAAAVILSILCSCQIGNEPRDVYPEAQGECRDRRVESWNNDFVCRHAEQSLVVVEGFTFCKCQKVAP